MVSYTSTTIPSFTDVQSDRSSQYLEPKRSQNRQIMNEVSKAMTTKTISELSFKSKHSENQLSLKIYKKLDRPRRLSYQESLNSELNMLEARTQIEDTEICVFMPIDESLWSQMTSECL